MLVGGLIATSVAGAVLDNVRSKLEVLATHGVRETQSTSSAVVLELSVPMPKLAAKREIEAKPPVEVPVAVTVYPKAKRVRVQVLTHDVTRREAELVEDAVAGALGMEVAHRSGEAEQRIVHEAIAAAGIEHTTGSGISEQAAWQEERR
jgi:hypothetical protein